MKEGEEGPLLEEALKSGRSWATLRYPGPRAPGASGARLPLGAPLGFRASSDGSRGTPPPQEFWNSLNVPLALCVPSSMSRPDTRSSH